MYAIQQGQLRFRTRERADPCFENHRLEFIVGYMKFDFNVLQEFRFSLYGATVNISKSKNLAVLVFYQSPKLVVGHAILVKFFEVISSSVLPCD